VALIPRPIGAPPLPIRPIRLPPDMELSASGDLGGGVA
jgi:hypothetical protein